MKMHLISLHPSIWNVVLTGVDLSGDDALSTPEEVMLIHLNAQAANVLLGALCTEERNKVDGLEEAKEISDTLRIAHEGTSSVRESKIELLEGQLGRFMIEEGETPQEMYNRMMVLVNKIHGLGTEEMTDHFVVKRLHRTYAPVNHP